MCTFVTVEQGGDRLECVSHGELTDALGGEPVYKRPAREPRTTDDCLCQVDAEATAKKYGYRYDPANSTFGDVILKKAKP